MISEFVWFYLLRMAKEPFVGIEELRDKVVYTSPCLYIMMVVYLCILAKFV